MTPLRKHAPPLPAAGTSGGAARPALTPWASAEACVWRRRTFVSLTLLLLTLAALVAWLYRVPVGYVNPCWGHNPAAAWQWGRVLLPHAPPTVSVDLYQIGFQLLLLAVWGSYAAFLLCAHRGGSGFPLKTLTPWVIAVPFLFAVLCPPSLSTDLYAYLGYARMAAVYHWNPYTHTPSLLTQAHDPVAPFIVWNWPTVYGSVWTCLAVSTVKLLHGAGLWGQLVAFKMIEAFSLLLTAWAGKRIAEHVRPGTGGLTFLAIGLNPLLLIEGVGSGHNDMLMIGLLMAAALFGMKNRPLTACLLLGGSIGIKAVTAVALPWMLIEACRGKTGAVKIRTAVMMSLATLLPLVVCYLPYWQGATTLAPLMARTSFMTDAATQAHILTLNHWMAGHGVPGLLIPLLVSLVRQWPLAALYTGLTVWLWRKPDTSWMTAWQMFSPALMFLAMGMAFPWYILWFWSFSLTRWNKFHVGLSIVSFALSLLWECLYSCLLPVGHP